MKEPDGRIFLVRIRHEKPKEFAVTLDEREAFKLAEHWKETYTSEGSQGERTPCSVEVIEAQFIQRTIL